MNIEKYFKEDGNAFYNKDGKKWKHSVHGKSYTRINKAKEQVELPVVDKKIIINYTKEFLSEIGITLPENYNVQQIPNINYSELKEQMGLKDEKDIIWMKFTTDGHLGVVAVSNDINFDIPSSCEDYDKKKNVYNDYKRTYEEEWIYNSSGILLHKLGKEWDTSFVLVFPLSNIPQQYNRGDIERAIGNFLIDKKVPIIDYYSHNY